MKFKIGDLVRPTRETIIDYIENGEFYKLEYYNEFQIVKIDGIKVFYGNKDGEYYTEKELELVPKEPEFEYGEEIEVTNDGENWLKRIFITKSKECRYVCVDHTCYSAFKNGRQYTVAFYDSARKSIPQLTRKEIANRFGVDENFILIDDVNGNEIQSRR